jgi:hypothetical protein
MDILAGPAQCAVFQLQIDAIVIPYLTAGVLDVPVGEFSDAAVGAAQQILIEVKYSNIEYIAQLFFQTSRIGRDAAQIIASRNQR